MSMNMIERVARAIAKAVGREVIPNIYIPAAKAAIEAMREPTEEMIELFNDHDWIDRYWQPAIDAALKE